MERLIFRQNGRVGRLTLNRPDKYNSFDLAMVQAMEAFLRERMRDQSLGVIILDGGNAKGFCAGLDINSYGPEILNSDGATLYDAQARMSRLFLAMRRIPQPIISCVHGAAAGIGFSLAMASDVRILATDARFSAAYINIGLGGADMASSYFLPRLIGSGRANEFLLTGNWMSAKEAMGLGFGSRLVERDEMIGQAEEIAGVMASKNPLGLRMTKEAVNASLDAGGLEACLQMEDRNQTLLSLAGRLS